MDIKNLKQVEELLEEYHKIDRFLEVCEKKTVDLNIEASAYYNRDEDVYDGYDLNINDIHSNNDMIAELIKGELFPLLRKKRQLIINELEDL